MQMYSPIVHYTGRVWFPTIPPRGYLLLDLLHSQSQIIQELRFQAGTISLPCTLLLRGSRLRSLHMSHTRMVFKGVRTPPVDDHLLERLPPFRYSLDALTDLLPTR